MDVTLRKLFQDDVVYRRTAISKFMKASTRAGFYNARFCDVKKLLIRVHNEELRNFEGTFPNVVTRDLQPYWKEKGEGQPLIFESRFESGNLEQVARVSEAEYNLLLQNDINSKGHTQWFFFRVSNGRIGVQYKLNIVNFVKPDSLFNSGMRTLVYSKKAYDAKSLGWHRGGESYQYYPNGIMRENTEKQFYTLSFTYQFQYPDDEVYFAYSFPYTYTQLCDYLDDIEGDHFAQQFLTRKTLCRSLAGNRCDYLTITNPGSAEEIRRKKGIVITGRVHPGETVGSWMMKGALDFLIGNSLEANALRDQFVFKIIPMLNPDGVVNGNYRCSLVGADLNRRWKKPHKIIHPIIYSAKRLIKSFASNFRLDLICDLHGHSRKKNIFMYGCNIKDEPYICKLFPYTLSKVSPVFHFPNCKFNISKSKEATMRVALFKETRIPCIYTLESSFLGPDTVSATQGKYAGMHFTTGMLQEMGRDLCLALLTNFGIPGYVPKALTLQPGNERQVGTQSRRMHGSSGLQGGAGSFDVNPLFSGLNRNTILKELLKDPSLLHHGEEDESSGSDSDPSDDNLEPSELAQFVPAVTKSQHSAPRKPLSKTSSRTILKAPNLVQKIVVKSKPKKCKDCGRDFLPNHKCPQKPGTEQKDPPKVMTAAPQKRPTVGVRTYYNLMGKRVHDQATQTPMSFYLNYKLTKQREKEARSSRGQALPSNPQESSDASEAARPLTDPAAESPTLSPLAHSVRALETDKDQLSRTSTGVFREGHKSRDRLSQGNLQSIKRSLYREGIRHSSVTANNSLTKVPRPL